MNKIKFLHYLLVSISFFFCCHQKILAQTFTDSNLPIVVITTDLDENENPMEIPDDPKIGATMKIIKRPDGSRNYLSDITETAYLNYNGKIGIELRGSSSQSLEKKPYGLTTRLANGDNNNVSLLGMPSENDWILNGFAFDATFMRDYLAYNLSRQLGQYASRAEYCEVVVNGDYKGVYLLSEKIKIDSDRVNIVKMTNSDNSAVSLTGGYITKCDKMTGGDPVAWSMLSYQHITDFIHEAPKPAAITVQQHNYIRSVFNSLQNKAHSSDIANGFPSVIDIPTFIDFMMLAEITSNVDVYQYSTFFHKDRGGKLRAGPIWDYNLSFGNDFLLPENNRSKTDVWQVDNGDNTGARFWKDLFDNEEFKCYFTKRLNELTQTGEALSNENFSALVDHAANLISEALEREHARWYTSTNHAARISELKNWYELRIQWMKEQLGTAGTCMNVVTPPLVITKIHYNPKTSSAFPVSNDLEFIEIQNTGAADVDLTGIYLRELGLSYQFPENTTLAAGSNLYLASNETTFLNQHGFPAFGQFTRNLSNSSQRLVLADALGNIIDEVEYKDKAPWPKEADGDGAWLELIDPSLDNSIATNWMAIADETLEVITSNGNTFDMQWTVYPNPASHEVHVKANYPLGKVELFDPLGNRLMEIYQPETSARLDISMLGKGMYLLKISNNGSTSVEKIIKQ